MKGEVRLALYRSLKDYKPAYGDYVIWSRWFTTWHGIISNYDQDTDDLYIIFAGVPFLLFTMSEEEQKKETKKIKLTKIKNASQGNWSIQQHHQAHNTVIWYI
jgi:hypothetical protein